MPMATARKTTQDKAKGYVYALKWQFLNGVYDAFVTLTLPENEFRQKMVDRLSPSPGSQVLDLGCGTGTLALWIARAFPKVKIIGIDGDQNILHQAAKKGQIAKADVHFQEACTEKLPFEDSTFDTVVSCLVFHHLTPAVKRLALHEARRVLKPGGRILIMDWGKPNSRIAASLFFVAQLFEGFETTRENREGKLPSLMSEAGFAGVVQTYSRNTMFGTLALYEGAR